MENLSHSVRQSKLSRKSSHANAAAKGIYDDVFGGPPKFGAPATLSPRAEDYREIFGGFHAPRVSSIPVLDLPVVDEQEVYFDVRSPGFDYSEVFGGFRGLDLGDGYEELFGRSSGGSAGCGSSDEAWTPAASESLSEESDQSIGNQYPPNGDAHHLVNGNIEYNISYHKANPRSSEEITSGLRRTAEIHAVPGYSYMVDHVNQYQAKEKHLKKTRSDISNGTNDVRHQKDFGRINYCPGETFMTISEVSLRTEPSHLPPPSRPPPRDINGPVSSWNAGYVEGNGDDNSTSSPPFFDVDGSSSAAAVASAAAMKEAMMKARAQLRSAKELMERKKDTRQSRVRMGCSGELGDMGGECLSEEIVQGTSRGKGSKMKSFIGEEPRDVMGTESAPQNSRERENFQGRAKQSAEKGRGKESAYYEMFGNIEEADEWKEATQFFELVRGDRSGAVSSPANKEELSESVPTHDNGEMEGMAGRFEGLENFNTMKTKVGKGAPKEGGVAVSKNVNPKATEEATIDKNVEKKEETGQDIGQREEAKKKHRKTHHDTETAVKLNGSESSEDLESLNDILTEVAREFEIRQVMERKRDELKPKMSSRRLEAKENVADGKYNEKRTKEPLGTVEKDRRPEFIVEPMGNEGRRPEVPRQEREDYRQRANLESAKEEANEREEISRRFKEALELEEKEKRMREVLEQEKRNKLKEAHEREENEKRVKAKLELAERQRKQEAAAREEQERRLREAHELAERNKLKEALEREETEKQLREAREQEEKERRRKEALEKQEKEKMLREALEKEKKEKMLREALEKEEEKEKMLREALEKEEKEKVFREALEKEEKEKVFRDALEKEEKEKVLRDALEKEEKEKMLREALEKEEKEKRLHEAREREEMRKRLEEAKEMENERSLREARSREDIEEKIPEANGREKSENSHREASDEDDYVSNSRDSCTNERDYDQGEIDDASRDTFELEELDKWLKEAVDVEEPDVTITNEADTKAEACMQNHTGNIQSDFPASGSKQVLREARDGIDASDDDTDQIRSESQGSENKFSATENEDDESKREDSMESPPLVDRPKQTNLETPWVSSQMRNESRHQEQNRPAQECGETKENANKCEANLGEDGKRVETQTPIVNAQRTSRQSQDASQAEGRKEKLNGKVKLQEKEAERLRREQEIEKDRLRKIEEEKEREREREKDRMGIDKATLEARERAYAEARERAERTAVERATAEARQRSLTEARERLEKACAEARERSFLEKTSAEARIRAERAAVERATAEARERAASRYNGMRQSSLPSDLRESQHQTAGSSSSTRYQHSSGYGAPSDVDKSEGAEGESAQRCRARLERHRRTAEREAKALAEKNMRDLQAQREQAERNRLSETLDADVKRWSSGKEGNLRALLSTLQYILGPDSGWQPVPLTEVITSVAVKKAYRKATLCVHPDKLQQRGASIQQKYVCEKVFDLLKEAWNKFNSEER